MGTIEPYRPVHHPDALRLLERGRVECVLQSTTQLQEPEAVVEQDLEGCAILPFEAQRTVMRRGICSSEHRYLHIGHVAEQRSQRGFLVDTTGPVITQRPGPAAVVNIRCRSDLHSTCSAETTAPCLETCDNTVNEPGDEW